MSETPSWRDELMHLLCDIVVKMNICKRCSAVRSWQWFSDLDASDCSTQTAHKIPPGLEPRCESDWRPERHKAKQKASIPDRHCGKLKDLNMQILKLDHFSDMCGPGLFLFGTQRPLSKQTFPSLSQFEANIKVFKSLGPIFNFLEWPGQLSRSWFSVVVLQICTETLHCGSILNICEEEDGKIASLKPWDVSLPGSFFCLIGAESHHQVLKVYEQDEVEQEVTANLANAENTSIDVALHSIFNQGYMAVS